MKNNPKAMLAAASAVFNRMSKNPGEDPVLLLSMLFDSIRPDSRRQLEEAPETWRMMLDALEENPEWREAVASTMLRLFAEREQRRFYTESGLLPNTGFFSELRRKVAHRLLPELVDPTDLRDCVHLIFRHPGDQAWMERIPSVERARFWEIIGHDHIKDKDAELKIIGRLIESARILALRISSMGLEPELSRVLPRLSAGESPFIALSDEVAGFVARLQGHQSQVTEKVEDEKHLLVLLDQCENVVQRAHQAAAARGTSMTLTFLIVRLHQHLERLGLLVRLLAVHPDDVSRKEINERWSDFFLEAVSGERQRNSITKHFSDLLRLLSLRVTENAGRTGEHYIARDRAEWTGIAKAAAGAGIIIAVMALMKLKGHYLHLPVFTQGVMNGLIYGLGFAIIHVFHFIVATKQPAMTAATIAATVSQTRGRLRDVEKLADIVVATVRSQVAAISGNIFVAFPLAVLIGFGAQQLNGASLMGRAKSASLLSELDPFAGTLVYAAIAGVWLFTAGLVSGYVDNLVAYSRTGDRLSRHPALVGIFGVNVAERFGSYMDKNAGGLAGNLFFGMMLGLTPAFGQAFGLPVDIRHIAFSAANLGYILLANDFHIAWSTLILSASGILLIGFVNLAVSFSLALYVALNSRGVQFSAGSALFEGVWRRLKTQPLRFITPGKE